MGEGPGKVAPLGKLSGGGIWNESVGEEAAGNGKAGAFVPLFVVALVFEAGKTAGEAGAD